MRNAGLNEAPARIKTARRKGMTEDEMVGMASLT